MRLSLIVTTCVVLFACMGDVSAENAVKRKKSELPALKFEGTWRVESHDLRELATRPANLTQQFRDEAGAFPVGQRLRFEYTGTTVLPGGIDPGTMRRTGPAGATLRMTILPPYSKELCGIRHWAHLCASTQQSGYEEELLIDDIVNWTRDIPKEYAVVWSDLHPFEYSFLQLAKSYHFGARLAKNGDIVIMVTVDGRAKGRGNSPDSDGKADVGIRLRRVDN